MDEELGWKERLRRDGYVHFRELVSAKLIRAARESIDADLAANYDPARQMEYDHQSFCPEIRRSYEIASLYRNSGVQSVVESVLGLDRVRCDPGQIAIRKAAGADRNYAPVSHIDGIPTEFNGLPGAEIKNFTALIGVFLGSVRQEFAGNFTVWPGSHLLLESYFRERGPSAACEGMPPIPLGSPVQLLCELGDVVLCHYQLAHAAAVNTSANDRYAVFFRLWLHDLVDAPAERRWQALTHLWDGWK